MTALVLDHLLVYGDVDRLAARVSATVGEDPVDGGVHPGGGTRNVIFAAQDTRALELLGPDGAAEPSWAPADPHAAVASSGGGRSAPATIWTPCATWLEGEGLTPGAPERGERVRATGDRVGWDTVDLLAHPYGATLPFLIRWNEGTPPWALDAAPACRIVDFRLGHPDPTALARVLGRLGLEVEVHEDVGPSLSAALAGPAGTARFSSR